MATEPKPRRGDVVWLWDGESLARVSRTTGRERAIEGCWVVLDEQGEEYLVVRFEERDDRLREAVHDDGTRRSWRVVR